MWDSQNNVAILTLEIYLTVNQLRSDLYKGEITGSLFMLGSLPLRTVFNVFTSSKSYAVPEMIQAAVVHACSPGSDIGSKLTLCKTDIRKVYFEQCLILVPHPGCKRSN